MTRFGLGRVRRLLERARGALLAVRAWVGALFRRPRAWAVSVATLVRRGLAWVGKGPALAWRWLVWPPLSWARRACARVWHGVVWTGRAGALCLRWMVWLPLVAVGRACGYSWRRLTRGRMARRVSGLAHKALYQPANPKPASFVLLLSLVTVLIVVGLIMVLSASSVESLREYGSSWAIFERQVLWVGLGAVALVLAARVDYRRWRRFATPLLVLCLLLLLAVLVPRLGVSSGGSSRWLGFGSLQLQPSELAKLGVVIFGADLLTRRADRIGDWKATIRPLLLVVGLACLLVIKQPDLGTAVILVCITLGLLFAAGTSIKGIGTLLGLSGVVALLVALAEPYRRARLLSFLNPWAHASGSGYQVVQSLVGLGSGHLLGVGLGASAAKWGFLPNAYTDFIFSVLGEELGLIGALLVVGLFVALAVVGIRVAVRSSDRFGGLLVAGITTWIVVQAVINIGGVAGMLPVTGVPLPFISYGGSSLVIMMAAVGLMLNVAAKERPRQAPALDPWPVRAGQGGLATVGVTPLHGPAAAVGRDIGAIWPETTAPPVARRRTASAAANGRGRPAANGKDRRTAKAVPSRRGAGSAARGAGPRVRTGAAPVRGMPARVPPRRAPLLTSRRRPRVTRAEL
jgi:cell division protein FtsW